MSNLSTYFPKRADLNQGGESVFENFYVWGKSYFDNDIVLGHEALFLDEVEFKDDVTFLNILVNNRLDVGVGKTILTVDSSLEKIGIFNPEPIQPLHFKSTDSNELDIVVTGLGTIGIGTTNPGNFDLGTGQGPLRLDVDGSVSIGRNIYDSAGSPGPNGAFLNRDEFGIRWVTFEPAFSEGIFIQDEGQYISSDTSNHLVGTAQSFTVLNFRQINSSGLGSDTVKPIPDSNNPTEVVRIQTQDLWGYLESESGLPGISIYRMSRVGIGSSAPYHRLQIGTSGTDFVVTDDGFVGIGTTEPHSLFQIGHNGSDEVVSVTGIGSVGIGTTNPRFDLDLLGTLNVDEATTLNSTLDVDEEALFHDNISILKTTTSKDLNVTDKVGIGTSAPLDKLQVNFLDSSLDREDKKVFLVKSDGLVGVGTKSPGANLDVADQAFIRLLKVSGIITSSNIAVTGLTTTNNFEVSGISTFVGISTFGIVGIGTDDPVLRITSTVTASQIAAGAVTINLDASSLTQGQTIIPIPSLIDEGTVIQSIAGNALSITLNKATLNQTLVQNQALNFAVDRGTILTIFGNADIQGITTFFDDANFKDDINVDGIAKFNNPLDSGNTGQGSVVVTGGVGIAKNLYVGQKVFIEETDESTSSTTGALQVTGGIGIAKSSTFENNVKVGGSILIEGNTGITSTLTDKNNNTGVAGKDYRLSSVGTGVSWRPPGVQTQNTIWVSKDGNDANSGTLEGDSKLTIGGAASIAGPSDTIIVRPGVYIEDNPIGLRTDVSIHGQDLRLVTVVPTNPNYDVFHVRRGCLIENINFAGQTHTTDHTGCGAVAFPPTVTAVNAGIDTQARSGYTEYGPINQGPSLRWRSPYIRNCTNFMTSSIGMKVNGDYANASFTGINSVGQDLKSMVCDSFTQYNENGIGVSLTNKAYAQLVSIFTINNDISIYADTGGACDLTNSNTSFGNFGLVAKGVSSDEYTATLRGYNDPLSSLNITGDFPGELDNIIVQSLQDTDGNFRKPFDGQGVFFKLNLANYNDTTATGITTEPLRIVTSVNVTNGGSGYSNITPPTVTVNAPLGPESIPAELSANIDENGAVESIDVISSGRNFLPSGTSSYEQDISITISSPSNPGGTQATAEAVTTPIYFTVTEGTEATSPNGISEITFNEFIPYTIASNSNVVFRRLSRIITSSHTFEYVGTGTDINRANPFQGGIPIPENEIVATEGANIPFTSTDQKGNFRIGEGVIIDQTSSTVRGTQFTKSIQANVTPLILALGGN